jgi:hypothetical protein
MKNFFSNRKASKLSHTKKIIHLSHCFIMYKKILISKSMKMNYLLLLFFQNRAREKKIHDNSMQEKFSRFIFLENNNKVSIFVIIFVMEVENFCVLSILLLLSI